MRSFFSDPMALKNYPHLFSQDGKTRFTLTTVKPCKDDLLYMCLEGVTDRTSAESLKGVGFYVPRTSLPPVGEGEYYHQDLFDLRVALSSGEEIGRVKAIHNFGANDVLEIQLKEKETFFFPFTKEAVPEVRLREGILVIDQDLWQSVCTS